MLLKEEKLINLLKSYKRVAVTFSGGIDSSYLLKVAVDTLGNQNVLALVVNSELFPDEEFYNAIDLANQMNAKVIGLEMSELSNAKIVANTPKSWYYSKRLLYQTIKKEVSQHVGTFIIVDGMNKDDSLDFRPGLKARDDEGVVSPLQLANLTKVEIRALAKLRGVTNWNQVSSCSIASRFPYGQKLTQKSVALVFKSENYLKSLGFEKVRVRIHQDLARIEVFDYQIDLLLSKRLIIEETLKQYGFNYVTMDLKGYQYGRMNDVLDEEIKQKIMGE